MSHTTEVSNPGVHRTHCCVVHGCKYGDPDCPVAEGKLQQDYICEECDMVEGWKNLTEVKQRVTESMSDMLPLISAENYRKLYADEPNIRPSGLKRYNIYKVDGPIEEKDGTWIRYVDIIPAIKEDGETRHPDDMRMIYKSEETVGRYATENRAELLAKHLTKATGIRHHKFLSHYSCPHDWHNKVFWGILKVPNEENKS